MTINKRHGQSLNKVEVYPPKQVLTYGQLYVEFSRITKWDGLWVIVNVHSNEDDVVKNLIYRIS